MSYLLVLLLFLVDFTPTGPLYIPINTQRNVTCHLEGNKVIGFWGIILNDGTLLVFERAQESTIPGITGSYVNGATNTLLITVNTTETSVTGLSCYIVVNLVLVPSTINVTIYGEKLFALKALYYYLL